MELELIGVGGADCRIADTVRAVEPAERGFLTDVFIFDSDATDLQRTVIPESHCHQYGQGTVLDGRDSSEVNFGHGFEIEQNHADELHEVLERGTPTGDCQGSAHSSVDRWQ